MKILSTDVKFWSELALAMRGISPGNAVPYPFLRQILLNNWCVPGPPLKTKRVKTEQGTWIAFNTDYIPEETGPKLSFEE